MSTYNLNSDLPAISKDSKITVITTEWNRHITDELLNGAMTTFTNYGLNPENIESFRVPGAVELTYAASAIMKKNSTDAIIVFGTVIKGDTPHFDYVCNSVTEGVTLLNAEGHIPIIFGVLTVNNEQQALDRIGGPSGHKGVEAAETAIRMISFRKTINI